MVAVQMQPSIPARHAHAAAAVARVVAAGQQPGVGERRPH